MSGFYPPPPIPKIVSSAITEDIPCRKCGYNIRGLANDALCPECGAMVSLSTRGDLIRYSDPKWIEKLSRGANWALWAILFTIACGAFDIANASLHLVKPLVPRALLLGQDLFTTAAWWLLTTPDPSGLGEDQYALPRKIMRAAVLARIIQICSNVLTYDVHLTRGIHVGTAILMTCANIAVCSGFIAQFPYLSRLALRIRSQSLAERAGKLSLSLGIPVGVVICAHSIMTLQRLIGAGGANKEITMIVGLASIGVLIFGFSYLRLLAGLAKALAEQRVLALQTWDRGA